MKEEFQAPASVDASCCEGADAVGRRVRDEIAKRPGEMVTVTVRSEAEANEISACLSDEELVFVQYVWTE